MIQSVIEAKAIDVQSEDRVLLEDISFQFKSGEAWAIVGESGSGKTVLGKVLAGQLPISSGELIFHLPEGSKRIFIPQQHDFRHFASTRSYYQQRYDSNVADDSPTVKEFLSKSEQSASIQALWSLDTLIELLRIQHVIDSKLTLLSNGEGKRVQLAYALLQQPQLLIFDNPFIGLDQQARVLLHEILQTLKEKGMILVVITTPDELPTAVDQVLQLRAGRVERLVPRETFIATRQDISFAQTPAINQDILSLLPDPEGEDFMVAVGMKNVTVAYGDKVVLENINWEVKRGEQWALIGPNGAGKSTLLSLINGDNPQAYSNEIYLFDQRRGSGESIWDIKRKVGYISPELHIYFQRDSSYTEAVAISSGEVAPLKFSQSKLSCLHAITSGYHDQVGSSQAVTPLQLKLTKRWMSLLQIAHLEDQNLYNASLGEQRLVLLARALVRNPPVLILDEPCQGLDKEQTRRFTEVVDAVCKHFNKTLIYISHYPQDIPSCVTKVLKLEKGKVVSR